MTDKEAIRRAQAHEPVYTVFGRDYSFYPCAAFIRSLGGEANAEIAYTIESEMLWCEEERYASDLFETWEEASAVAQKMQLEKGMRLVPESEYREFQEWKKAKGA